MDESKKQIYYHKNPENNNLTIPTLLKKSEISTIEKFIEKNIGKNNMVFHEVVSDIIHVDIYMIEPRKEHDFYTLVTVGMSALPMYTPLNVTNKYIELMISLPKTWKLKQEELKDENNYWPIRILKEVARFPFIFKTWLGFGHTIPNWNPPEAFSETAKFNGVLLLPSLIYKKSWKCRVGLFKEVQFLTIHPLYENEMDFKIEHGVDALLNKFDENKVNEIVDIKRPEISFI